MLLWENVPGVKEREGIEVLEVEDERGGAAKVAVEQVPSTDAMCKNEQ